MILGNHHIDMAADEATSSSASNRAEEEKIHRLRFMEKSLLIELDYIRRLEEMLRNPDEILHNNAAGTESYSDETTRCDDNEQDYETVYQIDHVYDYDRAIEKGFSQMYSDLDCSVHAHDQNKPMYTPEMWIKLWELFRDSTSFPFPIPNSRERPEEPYRAAHTTDGKGRGVFASRDIAKGSLVHPGHPNTVFFLNSKSWHRFVSSLPKMFACGKFVCPSFVDAR
jgi:hypothetical protein